MPRRNFGLPQQPILTSPESLRLAVGKVMAESHTLLQPFTDDMMRKRVLFSLALELGLPHITHTAPYSQETITVPDFADPKVRQLKAEISLPVYEETIQEGVDSLNRTYYSFKEQHR